MYQTAHPKDKSMSVLLLTTKFIIPPANPNLVRRERLVNLLDEGLRSGRLVTLVCAPAGYGKTTLVSQWIHQHEETKSREESIAPLFYWLTLDQGDNDLARFVSYLVAALQHIQAGVGKGTLAALQNVRSASPHVLATLLINDLSELVDAYVLILEDYHTINTQPIQDFMSFLIDHQPQKMHLVIISRSDPPLPLARLRARGQLNEIRQAELEMTEAESTEFLLRLMKLNMSSDQLQVLESRTEGWVAGLQLAALSVRHTEDIPAFIQLFSGGYEYIADYLTGEVLEKQNEATKNFLLQTSILKQFSASLCEAITGQPLAARILENLLDANIFLIPLDYNGEWYRYHTLFADLLHKRLKQSDKEAIANLHKKAGRWFAQNQMWDQAIEHYLAGEDYAAAANLIGKNVERILMHGQTATFLRWLEAFPIEQLYAHPVLIVYQGLAMMLLGKIPDNALSLAKQIASSSEKFRGEADTLQGLYYVLKGNAVEAIRLSESALEQLPAERSFVRILAADCLAMGYTLRGDLFSASQAFERVVKVAQEAGNIIMMLIGLTNLAGLHYQQGHLHQAQDGYQRVLDISKEQLGGCSQPMSRALLGMGELAREWNDLEAACRYISEAAEMFKQFVDIGLTVAYISLARVYLSQGEWDKVHTTLMDARQRSIESKTTTLDDNLTELMQARVWITRGELDQAEQWARRDGIIDRPIDDLVALADRNATAFELLQGEYLVLARLHIAQNEPNKALKILRELLFNNEKRAQYRRIIDTLVLQAIAYQQQGADEPAMQAFTRALYLAEPEGYVRTFLDEGQPVAQLLYRAMASGHHRAYAQNLITQLTRQGLPSPTSINNTGSAYNLVETLSGRECEVLGLIAEGLTNKEIGSRLHISVSTVKGHTTNIFGKLGVKNRTQAVAMAKNLGLVP